MTATEWKAYDYVRRGIAGTRAELSRTMNMSRPTASTVTEALISAGLLREGGKGYSSGGRNPVLLRVCPEAYSLVGMDMGYRDRISGVWLDAAGGILKSGDIMMPPDTPERAADAITRLWERLDPEFSACGIGLAVPGAVDSATGTVLRCMAPCFEGDSLVRILRRRFVGKHISLSGRVPAAAFSEEFGGSANREKNFLLLSRWGEIDSALCLNGRIFTGTHGLAGDLRRLPVVAYDGKTWCTLNEALAPEKIKSMGANPEQVAAVCARGLRHVLSILDPGMIVLSGRFSDFGDGFSAFLERNLAGYGCRVKLALYGRFTSSRGAALQTYPGR